MKTELDNVPSTITISLGLKNRIRKLKGSMTYEQYLNNMIRFRNEIQSNVSKNNVELVEFQRKSLVYFLGHFKLLYDYNKLTNSKTHIFDIRIKRILHDGKDAEMADLLKLYNRSGEKQVALLKKSYDLYFDLLETVIFEETRVPFTHKGRFEDFDSWSLEFRNLGLSKKSLEYDVKDKLVDYQSGVAFK